MVKCDYYIRKFLPILVKFAHVYGQNWSNVIIISENVDRIRWKVKMMCEVFTNFGQFCFYLLQTCGQYCQIWPKWVESVNDLCQNFGQFRSNLCGWHPQIWPKSGELYQPFLKSDQNRSDILLQSTFCLLNLSYFPFFTDEIYLSSF